MSSNLFFHSSLRHLADRRTALTTFVFNTCYVEHRASCIHHFNVDFLYQLSFKNSLWREGWNPASHVTLPCSTPPMYLFVFYVRVTNINTDYLFSCCGYISTCYDTDITDTTQLFPTSCPTSPSLPRFSLLYERSTKRGANSSFRDKSEYELLRRK